MSTLCQFVTPIPPASRFVDDGVTFMTDNAQTWANAAVGLANSVATYQVSPLAFEAPTFSELNFDPALFQPPEVPPEYDSPDREAGMQPDRIALTYPTFRDIAPPDDGFLPDSPNVNIPAAPTLPVRAEPVSPGISMPTVPVYEGEELPRVPELRDLNLPTEPEINLAIFDVERPDFEALLPTMLENRFYEDVDARRVTSLVEYRNSDLDGAAVRARWNEMILGGTGLPIEIEQALFDRGIAREDTASQQAVVQAQEEWAARGFTLPGSTVLARVSEARNNNRMARAGTNRELTIQYHEKEIENMRFAVQQGVALEGQFFDQFSRVYDTSRQVTEGFYDVARAMVEAQLSYIRTQVEIYQADIQAYRDLLAAELAKLEIFRAQLEAQRLIGEINKLDVDLYTAQLQGVLAGVEIFKAQIDAFNAEVRGELGKVELFRGQVDAFRGLIETDKLQVDVFNSRVNAEKTKADVFSAEVSAFAERVRAYAAEVQAESSRTDATTRIEEGRVRNYSAQVEAWRAETTVDIENIRAAVNVFQAETQRYNALITAEEARVRGESRNIELAANRTNAEVAAALKSADQQLEQMRHLTSLGLEALNSAARTFSQLTASALSAVNLSAGISHGFSGSVGKTVSCNFSGEV
jgi:hypothetical protein